MLSPTPPSLQEAALPTARRGRKQVVGGREILSRRVRREVERQISEDENVLFCLRGRLAHSLVALDERLLIVKPGFHAGTTFGTLTTTFYYQDVTGIQLNTFILSGSLEVSSPSLHGQGREHNRQSRTSDRDIYSLPNCIPIAKRRMGQYHDALRQLRESIAFCKRYSRLSSEAPPLISSLERIADLRRNGALSEHEYARLKQVLLESADRGTTICSPQFHSESG